MRGSMLKKTVKCRLCERLMDEEREALKGLYIECRVCPLHQASCPGDATGGCFLSEEELRAGEQTKDTDEDGQQEG